jgi:hypothetical protein
MFAKFAKFANFAKFVKFAKFARDDNRPTVGSQSPIARDLSLSAHAAILLAAFARKRYILNPRRTAVFRQV